MEDSMSMNSYMQQKPVASKAATTTGGSSSTHESEESGWTAYFEDFKNNSREEDSYCSSFGSPSLISDAASCAAWKLSNKHNVSTTKMPKKLRFKKPRTKQICDDDSLEDTASSPVNSPKGKEAASGHYSELQQKERSMNFNIGQNDCTDLKRRGLCLVHMSMLVNYLG